MPSIFLGKVAIVTGGASGIGEALCESLCIAGARVIVADVNFEQARLVASRLTRAGGLASAAYVNVADSDEVETLIANVIEAQGRLDFMFNNAAAAATRGELVELSPFDWHRAIDVNLLGVVYGSKAAASVMRQQGSGHLVNIGSIAGLIGYPTSTPYGATKAAVINLTLSMRMELAESGIQVNVVCPGPIHGESDYPFKLIGVKRAADLILRGVARDKALIVFPLSARVFWLLYRLSPRLLFPIGRKLTQSFRRHRMRKAKDAIRT